PDLDSDGVQDQKDNCVSTPNASQSDADLDNIGDACDPTPVHDLQIVAASSSSPVVEDGSGMLKWWVRVRNGEAFPDKVAVYSSAFVPTGCRLETVSGET